MSRKQFSPVTPLPTFWIELGISRATGKKIEKNDPDFPLDELVQVGGFGAQPRLGITERGKQRYQQVLAERAARVIAQPRPISPNLAHPRAAAAKSVEVRRAKSAARRAEQAGTP